MARDHALAVAVSEPGRSAVRRAAGPSLPSADHANAVLRLYTWSRPTVSFGRNEPARGLYDAAMAERLGIDVVRRPTGGRAVLHDAELTYAVVVPARALGGARTTYHAISEALVDAMQSLGADVLRSGPPREGTLPLDAGPCFQSPSEGEVVVRGRKLVGSAQARLDGALLQHGSIILSGDQTLLTTLCPGVEHEQPATLAEQIGHVEPDVVATALVASMKKIFGGTWTEGEYSEGERQTTTDLVATRYGLDEWTWRR